MAYDIYVKLYCSRLRTRTVCLQTLAVCIERVYRRTEHQNLQGSKSPLTVAMFHNLYDHVGRALIM